MGSQRKETNNVGTTHRKAKNAVDKGFFEAFKQKVGLETPVLLITKDPAKGVGDRKVSEPYPLVRPRKKMGEGLTSAEPFSAVSTLNNDRKESK